MLGHYLKSATKDIQKLIELTETDIALIKEAKHDDVAQRAKIKNDLVQAFQSKKALLDNELIKRVEASGGKPLTDVLTKEEHAGLEAMKEALTTLHKINKEYAKYVVTISEFYNSLLDSMFPRESEGYQKSTPKPASILKVRA
jgi:Zn-dependent M32 family carboxypeptidase